MRDVAGGATHGPVAKRWYFDYKQRCIYCDYIRRETKVFRDRLMHETGDFIALCPFAARFPFEMWILAKRHCLDYAGIEDREALDLAGLLKVVLQKLRTALKDPPFSYVLHTAPFRRRRGGYWASLDSHG